MNRTTKGWRAGALAVVGGTLGVLLMGAPAQAQCIGDCNGDGEVTINELITGVNIALGSANISSCESLDVNGDGEVTINELISAVSNALNGCPPEVDTPTPTITIPAGTATATITNTIPLVDTPTPTPTEVPTVAALGSVECTLNAATTGASELLLQTAALPIRLVPNGSFSIDCGAPGEDGVAECACELIQFGALVIPGIGDVCVNPAFGCEPGKIDCDGGAPVDVDLNANHNIGSCTSNAECQTACEAHCAALGAGYARQGHACEGYCLGGSNDENECSVDSDCAGGSCPGRDPVNHVDTCNCTCAGDNIGDAAPAGGLYCNLGTQINVELPVNGSCGDTGTTLRLAPACGGVSSGTSVGVINNANDAAGTTIPATGPESLDGANVTCEQFSAEQITGLKLVGQLAFFDSALGDIRSRNTFVCQ